MITVIGIIGVIIVFIAGVLVGRANPKKADSLYKAAKKAKEEADALLKKARENR